LDVEINSRTDKKTDKHTDTLIAILCHPYRGPSNTAADAGSIDALLKLVHRWSLSKDIVTVSELLNKSGISVFQKMYSPSHCLNPLLPSKKIISYNLRNSDNSYVLPQCKLNVFSVHLLTGVFLLGNN